MGREYGAAATMRGETQTCVNDESLHTGTYPTGWVHGLSSEAGVPCLWGEERRRDWEQGATIATRDTTDVCLARLSCAAGEGRVQVHTPDSRWIADGSTGGNK